MLFSDPVFFLFFLVYFVLHLLVPPRARLLLIIIGSSVFYAWWRPAYLWLPFLLIAIAWTGVAWIERVADPASRKLRLGITLASLFLPLAVVKYSYFVVFDAIGHFVDLSVLMDNPASLKFPLPLGISFITFTLTAYVVDVYRGVYKAERQLTAVVGYVLFFPHLVAGPILRPHELIPQLKQARRALGARFTVGIAIFTLGLLKKLLFADQLGIVADRVFASGGASLGGWDYLLGIYAFSVQIYCDFSGYTDMAIGIAYLLRVRLPTNFLRPYAATSIIDFWRRWHITLSHWLRDYLYIPLGGNRGGERARFRNVLVTMVLGGLWHGASWTFVVWGLVHGLAIGVTHMLQAPMRRWRIHIPRAVAVLLTFHLVTASWVFFRASSLTDAGRVFGGVLTANWDGGVAFAAAQSFPILLLAMFAILHPFDRHALVRLGVRRLNPGLVWPAIGLCWILAIAVSQGSSAKFIYFDF
jgi:alginate O-acetyltransferase complex protein AlgI